MILAAILPAKSSYKGSSWIIWPIAAVLFTLINVIWSVAIKVEIKDD